MRAGGATSQDVPRERGVPIPAGGVASTLGWVTGRLVRAHRVVLVLGVAWSLSIGALARTPFVAVAGLTVVVVAEAGMVLHEVGHIVALRRVTSVDGAGRLVASGLDLAVVHPALPPHQRAVVAAAGPLVAAVAGLPLVVGAVAADVPALGVPAVLLIGHIVNLLPWIHDGATIQDALAARTN